MDAPPPVAQRQRTLKALADETFDLLVIGGGITGAGVARDAQLRGLKVALIEKDDFAAGTSSKSSKLVHGGLRYLEHGEIKLVFESVNERALLMRLARPLVRPLPFLFTRYQGDERSLPVLDVGLWVYDALCGFRAYRNHRTFGKKKTLGLEPGLDPGGLSGGILYYDCLTDDARLTLENVIDARALGAVIANHVRAKSLLKAGDAISGAEVVDGLSGDTFAVRAKLVVSASGPWTDEVRAMLGDRPLLKPTKGVHAVLDAARLPVKHAVVLRSPKDRRVLFAIPWGLGRTVVGTTDTFFEGDVDRVEPTREDIDYLLGAANRYFPDAKLTAADVLSTWAGLRPLLRPEDDDAGASAVSREHLIVERPGLLTIAGGKLTTFRRMATEVVDRALGQLGEGAPSTTAHRPLPGAEGLTHSDDLLFGLAKGLEAKGLSPRDAAYFSETYGSRAPAVLARTENDATAGELVDPELPYRLAQVDEALEHEQAVTLDDMLTRRLPLVLRGRDQGLSAAPKVAQRMAKALAWDTARVEQELTQWRAVVDRSRAWQG